MKKAFPLLIRSLFALSLLITINSCEGGWFEKAAYGGINSEGQTLKLLVVQKPLTYRRLHQLESGFEFDLIQQFALDTGYRLQVQTVRNETALTRELARGKGDLGAARFSSLSNQIANFSHSPIYDESRSALICRKGLQAQFLPNGNLHPDSRWKLLVRPTAVPAPVIQSLTKAAPHLKMVSRWTLTPSPLLREMAQGKGDCTLLDHLEAQYYLRVFPTLEVVKDVSAASSYFFLIAKSRPELEMQMRHWMTKAARRHVISAARSRVQGEWRNLSDADIRSFLSARDSVFPRYAALFRKHSEAFGIPWQLSAAVAYQESKWNPEAESFTGVRGFMQLTQETAEHLGVEDRTNTEQSIWGGVKYLKMLLDRQPKGLPFREKMALALATYNVGPAHMLDAQKLAQKLGKNPYAWKDLQEILPLLSDKDYLPDLKYGPARGQEPVDYVDRVFAYLDLISVQI